MTKTPHLRFPEFEGVWDITNLGEAFTIFNGYAFASSSSVEDGLLWVKITDVGIQEMKKNNLSYLPFSLKEKHKKFILTKGDFVVALTRPILNGKLKIAQINSFFDGALLNQRVGKIVSNNSHYFIYSLLQKDELIKSIENNIAGSDPPNLSPNEINSIKISYPPLPEQQKIASFLSAVDEKIQQLSRKKELLSQYKKGVMHQLFSGKLRFKDENGKDYADWKIIKVQELINKKAIISLLDGNHGALYPKSEEFTEKGIPYVAANNLVNGQVKFSECKYLPVERAKKFKKGIAKNGDVLFAHNATVGPTALLKTELDYIILSTTVTYYRCDLNILSNTYLLHYFNSDNFISQYSKVMSQSTRNQVPITMQKKFNVDFPCLEEQQKIANLLSSIDTKIESTTQQINQMQSFKKGLLQQLFV
jgi:type I restriction enzyme S subunit